MRYSLTSILNVNFLYITYNFTVAFGRHTTIIKRSYGGNVYDSGEKGKWQTRTGTENRFDATGTEVRAQLWYIGSECIEQIKRSLYSATEGTTKVKTILSKEMS